jgi:hypothetical protein
VFGKSTDETLRLYPGAQPKAERGSEGKHRGSLRLDNVSVAQAFARKYTSSDAAANILAFYKTELQRFGAVTQCDQGSNTEVSITLSQESLGKLAACRAADLGEGEIEVKAGTAAEFYIVSVRTVDGHSEFTVVHARGARKHVPGSITV